MSTRALAELCIDCEQLNLSVLKFYFFWLSSYPYLENNIAKAKAAPHSFKMPFSPLDAKYFAFIIPYRYTDIMPDS